jgi:phage tail-like protein
MANPAFETVVPPYTAFRFEVVLNLDDPPPEITNPVCNAAFSDCSGLEMSMQPKEVRQGGDNGRVFHLPGQVSYGQLTLQRGMTANLQLWNWMAAAIKPGRNNKAQGEVTMFEADGTARLVFVLEDCLPVKVSGPTLNAKDGLIAIEQMQLVYATLTLRPADQAGAGFGLSVGLGGGISGGFSAGVSAGFSAGASVSGGPGLSGGFSAGVSASAGFGIG